VILMLDNYDSFTFNLVACLEDLGEAVEVRRSDTLTVAEAIGCGARALVLSPGPGRPEEAGICLELVASAAGRVPLLGICLGHQVIVEACGGRVVPAPTLVHGKTSAIHHDGRSVFSGIPSPFPATRYHSLIAERGSLPPALEVSAWTDDGSVMGIRHRSQPLEGVQFHPESILTREGKRLLANWVGGLAP
jgi:anthranilate synthase/aminodeoxychorismate synthase-like glutamine amidotransferase